MSNNSLNQAWHSNHGWMLSGAALAVGAVASLVWYLDWVPRLSFTQFTKQPVISQSIQAQTGILVAHVEASKIAKTNKGRIQLYLPDTDQTHPPVFQEKFTLDEHGMAAILLVVPARDYVAVAYIDSNDNGQLDFEDGKPVESFTLPRPKQAEGQGFSELPAENGMIEIKPQVPLLCVFEFESR